MFSSVAAWLLVLSTAVSAQSLGETCSNGAVRELPAEEKPAHLKSHSLLQIFRRPRPSLLEIMHLAEQPEGWPPVARYSPDNLVDIVSSELQNRSAQEDLQAWNATSATDGNVSSDRLKLRPGSGVIPVAENASSDEQKQRSHGFEDAKEAHGNNVRMWKVGPPVGGPHDALTQELVIASLGTNGSASATQHYEVNDVAGMNLTDGKPKEKPKLLVKGKKAKDEAKDEKKMDKLEMDYRKGKTKTENTIWAKTGIHPVQAVGFAFLTVMFACWGVKIYKEHNANTW